MMELIAGRIPTLSDEFVERSKVGNPRSAGSTVIGPKKSVWHETSRVLSFPSADATR